MVVAFWLLLLMLVPFNISRIATILEVPVRRQQLIMIGGLILAVFLTWRMVLFEGYGLLNLGWLTELFGQLTGSENPYRARVLALFTLVAIGWWRGIALVGRRVDVRDSGFRFRLGILLLAIFVAGVAGTFLAWSVMPFILLFIFTSLTTVVLTRVEELELDRSGRSFPLSPRWLLVVMAAAGFLTFLTGAISGVISGDPLEQLAGWMSPLWIAITFFTASVASVVSYLFVPIIIALEWFLGILPFDFGPPDEAPLDINMESPFATLQPEQVTDQVPQLIETSQRILPILVMVFVVLLISLALGRLFRIARGTAEPEASTMGMLEGIEGVEIAGFRKRLLERLGFLRRWRAAASVRRIYRAMSEMAAAHGFPRLESETPYEYLQTLEKAWSGQEDLVHLITDAYVRVRYGEIPEEQEELDNIKEAWNQLRENKPVDILGEDSALHIRRNL